MKKKSTKATREAEQKAALRKRLRDMAIGAGIDCVDDDDYWGFDPESIVRLVRAVDQEFSEQIEGHEDLLKRYWNLVEYSSLDKLCDWMFRMGYRASRQGAAGSAAFNRSV